MKSGLYKNKAFTFEWLYALMLIIYAGNASNLVRSLNSWNNIWGLILPVAMSVCLAFKHKVKIKKPLIILISTYTIYFIALTIKFGEFHPRFYAIYLIYFIIAYVSLNVFKLTIFIYYENILYYLCIISLMFWVILLIFPYQFANLLHSISLEPGSPNVHSNILIYTISDYADSVLNANFSIGPIRIFRNAGFAWEPGAFSVLINLAIFFNLLQNKFKTTKNKSFWIFVITLITTFSTTGYSIFMMLMLLYIYNQKIKYVIWLSALLGTFSIYIITLPFMYDKIKKISQEDNTEEQIENSIKYGISYTPQRIQSFIIDWQDFLNNPILGYGGHIKERWISQLGADVASISGIGKVFAKFGLVGAIFFFLSLFKSSKLITWCYDFKGWFFPYLLIIMISISYSLIEMPLFMCFWMIGMFLPMEDLRIYLIKNIYHNHNI